MKKRFRYCASIVLIACSCFTVGAVQALADETSSTSSAVLPAADGVALRDGTALSSDVDPTEVPSSAQLASSSSETQSADASTEDGQDPSDPADSAEPPTSADSEPLASRAAPLRAPAAPSPLQQMIDDAPNGGTVTITSDMGLTETVVIPAGKSITLTDDGTARTIKSTAEPMFKVEGTLTIAATSDANLRFFGSSNGTSSQGSVATVTGALNLKSGTFTGGAATAAVEGTVAVFGGTFAMTGGLITGEPKGATGTVSTATVLVWDGSTFTMTGGSITGNRAISGWAVITSGSQMSMTGGSIDGNAGGVILTGKSNFDFSGGSISNNTNSGIKVNSGTTLAMTGGTISGNEAGYMRDDGREVISPGAGICVRNAGTAVISGGTISGNHSNGSGGGIYADESNDLTITGCTISGNSAASLGGGVYINSTVSTLRIDSALVTGNTASLMGGGVWCCPTSEATIGVTDGMAIFDNSTTDDPSAGDDFANLNQSSSEGAKVTVSDRMLGGGVVSFYRDGAIAYAPDGAKFFDKWKADPAAPRFDASNPGDPVHIDGTLESRALKSVASDDAKRAARLKATTVIIGNTAKAGGGIATNGSFTSGKNDEGWKLSVNKVWGDAVPASSKKAVPVYLVIDGTVLDHVVLSQDNGYQAAFEGLPNPDSVGVIEVREGTFDAEGKAIPVEPANTWDISYSTLTKDETTKTLSGTVTNEPIPETIAIPIEKKWIGDEGKSVVIELLADGKPTGKMLPLNAENSWKGTFEGLAKRDSKGALISYSVRETRIDDVDGDTYMMQPIQGTAEKGFTITNVNTTTVDVAGSKTWNDDGDRDGMRPESITVHLLADGVEKANKTVTAADGWKWSFEGLAKYDQDDGHEISYTLTEDAVAGYVATSKAFDITNAHNPQKTSVKVEKKWDDADNQDGLRPASVTVKLLADGVDTGKTAKLSDEGQWTAVFDDLLAKSGGCDIVYTVEEVDVPEGYTVAISGDVQKGFTVTNAHKPTEPDTPKPNKPHPDRPSVEKTPQTGDVAGAVAAGIAIVAVGALVIAVVIRRKMR